jgi:hypothetical protein
VRIVLLGLSHDIVETWARELGYERGSYVEVTADRPALARGLRPDRVIVVGPVRAPLDAPIDYFEAVGAPIEYKRTLP